MINKINGGSAPYVPNADASGGDRERLEQQKQMLLMQLQRLQAKQRKTEADDKQQKMLERKIEQIEQQIQKLSHDQNKGANTTGTSDINTQKPENSPISIPLEKSENCFDQCSDNL